MDNLSAERAMSLFPTADGAPHPSEVYFGGHRGSIQEVHGMQRRGVQAEKMDWCSCFSFVSGLLQPEIISGVEFAQEAKFSPLKNW